MEKILSQDEIDHLFRAAQGGAPKARAVVERAVKQCDFRQAGQLSKDQVRQVTLLHETFPPSLASSLGVSMFPRWMAASFGHQHLLELAPASKIRCWVTTEPGHGTDQLDPGRQIFRRRVRPSRLRGDAVG